MLFLVEGGGDGEDLFFHVVVFIVVVEFFVEMEVSSGEGEGGIMGRLSSHYGLHDDNGEI